MPDDAFGPLEDSFFAAGDAYSQQKEDSPDDDQAFVAESETDLRLRLSVLKARLRPTLTAAKKGIILQARLLQLRVLVALATYAELALALRAVATPVRVRVLAVHAFIPQIARNPVVARFSLFVLVFTAATFPAAAVLAATGAL